MPWCEKSSHFGSRHLTVIFDSCTKIKVVPISTLKSTQFRSTTLNSSPFPPPSYTKTKPIVIPEKNYNRHAHKVKLISTTHTKPKWIESRIKNKLFSASTQKKSICIHRTWPSQFRSSHENKLNFDLPPKKPRLFRSPQSKKVIFDSPHKIQVDFDPITDEIKSGSTSTLESSQFRFPDTKTKSISIPKQNIKPFSTSHKNRDNSDPHSEIKSFSIHHTEIKSISTNHVKTRPVLSPR